MPKNYKCLNTLTCEMSEQERKKRLVEKNDSDFLNDIRVSVRRQDSTLVKDVSLGIGMQNINSMSIRFYKIISS